MQISTHGPVIFSSQKEGSVSMKTVYSGFNMCAFAEHKNRRGSGLRCCLNNKTLAEV